MHKLYISNVSTEASVKDFENLFDQWKIPYISPFELETDYALVVVPDEDSVTKAIESVSGKVLHGRTMIVEHSVPKKHIRRPHPQENQANFLEELKKQRWGFFMNVLQGIIDKIVAGRFGVKFFVPLCGKAIDMKWLVEMGHNVVGVEKSEKAIRQFFEENNMSFTEETTPQVPGAKVFRNEEKTMSLYHCDIYSFTSSFEGEFDVILDRGALVGIDPKDREKYAAVIKSLMAPGCRYLLETFLFDPEKHAGPPFLVTDEQVHNLFGSVCEIEALQEEDALTEEWAECGLDSLTEKVHLLIHKGH